jgi:hypothetical protein
MEVDMKHFVRMLFMAVIVIILLMLTITAVALASAPKQESVASLSNFLLWMVTGGSVIAVSWLCERWKWFQAQTPDNKKYIQYGASALLGIAALLVQNYVTTAILELMQPYFAVLAAVFGMLFLNQAAHVNDPATWREK